MTYRERRERRAARLREWADKREAKSEAALDSARRIAEMIPMGQPILAGHHSEGRHRRDLGRLESGLRIGLEHARVAGSMRGRADTIEAQAEHAIYSDDDDAADRLEERLAELEAKRERIKAYNATCRRGKPDPSGLNDEERTNLASCLRFAAWQCKGEAFPSYVLSNLSGNIGRQRKRLVELRTKVETSKVPAFRRVAEGDYETDDGRARLYRLRDVLPPAWNVDVDLGDGPGRFESPWRTVVDGAATKRDALGLFAEWHEQATTTRGDQR